MKLKLFLATLITIIFGYTAPTAGAEGKVWYINFPWEYGAGDYVCMNSNPYPIENLEYYSMFNNPLDNWCSMVRRVGYPNGINYAQASGFKFIACYVLDHDGLGSELVDSMERSASLHNVPAIQRWAAGYITAKGVETYCPEFLPRLMA